MPSDSLDPSIYIVDVLGEIGLKDLCALFWKVKVFSKVLHFNKVQNQQRSNFNQKTSILIHVNSPWLVVGNFNLAEKCAGVMPPRGSGAILCGGANA